MPLPDSLAPHPGRFGRDRARVSVRLNRGGNRAMNYALHMIAVTQARGIGPGRAYLDKQTNRGKDRTAGFRLLRRRLSDVVYASLKADQPVVPPALSTLPTVPWPSLLDIGATPSSTPA